MERESADHKGMREGRLFPPDHIFQIPEGRAPRLERIREDTRLAKLRVDIDISNFLFAVRTASGMRSMCTPSPPNIGLVGV